MGRRRVTFEESWRKASEGPTSDNVTHMGIGEFVAAIWYWIVGEPVADDEAEAQE